MGKKQKKKIFARNFFNDADGFTKDDLEKLLLLILTCLTFLIGLIMYIIRGDITPNYIYLSTAVLTATVARKGLSYIKPDRYYGNDTSEEKIKANNPEIPLNNGYNSYGYDPYGMNGYGNGYSNVQTQMGGQPIIQPDINQDIENQSGEQSQG